MHLHLDPVGGIAGDMFVAALLDLHPEHAPLVREAVRAAGLGPEIELECVPHHDGVLGGRRFCVARQAADAHAPRLFRADHALPAHAHVRWAMLRSRLEASALHPGVRARALAIFAELAEAEAYVHAQAIDEVSFHEIGAWDSIVDIVAGACLLEACGPTSWSIGPIPLGSGRVHGAHGELPVPAPAVVRLLAGFSCVDDGLAGERVTPTGAAIVRHLAPATTLGMQPRVLRACGHGFGARRLSGLSNVLRVMAYDDVEPHAGAADTIAVVGFEIDDQTGEDLATALARLRLGDGVVDIVQTMVIGKQGRMVSSIQALVRPECVDAFARTCFTETTTLGLRVDTRRRIMLPRRVMTQDGVDVKVTERPGGNTAKAEMRDIAQAGGHAERMARRHSVEAAALRDLHDD